MSIDQIKKCAELELYQTVILNDEITRLQETVQQKKKKTETIRSFISSKSGGPTAHIRQERECRCVDEDTIVLDPSAKNKLRKP
ncbi:hypothetical protein V1504DRAFT_461664 [Lipomyces starkeyi]